MTTPQASESTLDFLWFLPTNGDVRYFGAPEGIREVDNFYLREIAQVVDRYGYHGMLLPTGPYCEDSWIIASSIVTYTERTKFLVALRPGSMCPAEAARKSVALDRLSGGRLLINIVAGGDPKDLAGDGNFLSHDERYAQTEEFVRIWRGLVSGEEVNIEGKHLSCRGGRVYFPPVQSPHPPLYFGGASPAARAVAAQHIDLYLSYGEPPELVRETIEEMRGRAARFGRTLRFGIRLHFIVRETDEEAWNAANSLISHVSDDVIAAAQQKLASSSDSVGQKRMAALHGGDRRNLEVSPNLWAGVGLIRAGAGTALVGSPATVAARVREYMKLGIDTVIGSGYPHLEEAYRVAEMLFPHLPVSGTKKKSLPASSATTGAILLNESEMAAKRAAMRTAQA